MGLCDVERFVAPDQLGQFGLTVQCARLRSDATIASIDVDLNDSPRALACWDQRVLAGLTFMP
jgi:hypothetical protein